MGIRPTFGGIMSVRSTSSPPMMIPSTPLSWIEHRNIGKVGARLPPNTAVITTNRLFVGTVASVSVTSRGFTLKEDTGVFSIFVDANNS